MSRTLKITIGALLLATIAGCAVRKPPYILPPTFDTQVTIYLRLDPAGGCVSYTPGVTHVHQNAHVVWNVVHLQSPKGACAADTRVELVFPKGIIADPVVREGGSRPSKGKNDETDKRDPGDTERTPSTPFQLRARAVGKPGLYKYSVEIVGGAVEDPPFEIWPPP